MVAIPASSGLKASFAQGNHTLFFAELARKAQLFVVILVTFCTKK
jgi:hypothetical protein